MENPTSTSRMLGLDWRRFETLITESERVLLTTHVRPDGDALGSEIAMAQLLGQKGKEVEIYNPSPTPERYRFIDPENVRVRSQSDGVGSPDMDPDLLVILDTGVWSQLAGLADYVRGAGARKVVIDHHATQDDLGAFTLVDGSASACCMIVYGAFAELGGILTPESADALFLGIAMDTGWMRHPNTTPEVLQTLGTLVAAGADPTAMHRRLFEEDSPSRLRLLGRMLQGISLHAGGRLAAAEVTLEDIRVAEAHPMETEDFVLYPMGIRGVEAALLFIEQRGGGTKVSFRSRGALDCSRLAGQFGGGGHRPAAGATLDIPMADARERVLRATQMALGIG